MHERTLGEHGCGKAAEVPCGAQNGHTMRQKQANGKADTRTNAEGGKAAEAPCGAKNGHHM